VARYSPSGISYSFGPGPLTPAVRAIIIANAAVFVLTLIASDFIVRWFGLSPKAVIESGRVWQLGTYLFVHSPQDLFHILFNMLSVWMFGVELERRWGTLAFTVYYFVTGVGAGLSVLLVSILPFDFARPTYEFFTIGASGAVYGLLLAWAMIFPNRQIIFFIFPLPARVFVMIFGGIALFSALATPGGRVSHLAHLGGLLVGWIYLKGPKNLELEFKYRLTRWRMARMRRRFGVHRGGKDDDRIH
jgi:membrane associated rhomboid family serine protease